MVGFVSYLCSKLYINVEANLQTDDNKCLTKYLVF
jgi:hypothetical protein